MEDKDSIGSGSTYASAAPDRINQGRFGYAAGCEGQLAAP
jgi:hypothetical protein